MRKLYTVIGVITVSLILFGVLLYSQKPVDEVKAGTIVRTINVVGTGTSTPLNVEVATFATSTGNIFIIGQQVDTIDFDIYAEDASSTASVTLHIFKSSLAKCGKTGGVDEWIDAISINSVAGAVTTLNAATSTLRWAPPENDGLDFGKKFQLTDLNAFCLRVDVGREDVNLYIQATLKSN